MSNNHADYEALISQLAEALLMLEDEAELRAFLDDLLTKQEILSFAKRLEAARLLKNGATYQEVREKVEISNTTITRINTFLQYGDGGYQNILTRLEERTGKKK